MDPPLIGGARWEGFPALYLERNASRLENASIPGKKNCNYPSEIYSFSFLEEKGKLSILLFIHSSI